MSNLCIIPARGGSKRIPRKNIKDFLGKPIIAYSIQVAINSNLFDEIMISTDDYEIAEIGKSYGAKVPFMRSNYNANDYSSTADVLDEVIDKYNKIGRKFKRVCCIYPCAPLIKEEKLIEAYNKLIDNKLESVIPIVSFSFPVQRSFLLREGKVIYAQPEHEKTRSQDLEEHYHDVGQFYWFNSSIVKEKNTLVTAKTGFVLLNEKEVQDIDVITDWKMAEIKYKFNEEN